MIANYYKVSEIAQVLRVKDETVRRLIRQKRLRALKVLMEYK